MIAWIILLILGILIMFIVKIVDLKHRLTIAFIILLILFLWETFTILKSNHNLDISTTEGFIHSTKLYLVWLGNGISNIKTLAGDAIKMDWTSTNSEIFNKTRK